MLQFELHLWFWLVIYNLSLILYMKYVYSPIICACDFTIDIEYFYIQFGVEV